MTTTTTTAIPRIGHDEAEALGLHANHRLIELLEDLDPRDWARPTDCDAWDVSDIVGHVIGAAEAQASLREEIRQLVHGLRHRKQFGGSELDALNDLQVREHAAMSPAERITALREVTPRAVHRRTHLPALLGRIPIPITAAGSLPGGLPSSITLRHLNDVIYTRDSFLHRIDIARATDRDPGLDDDGDRRIVADAVAEWAQTHGRPFVLELEGPAGGVYRQGTDGQTIRTDVVTFCRSVTGRFAAEGLLATPVLF